MSPKKASLPASKTGNNISPDKLESYEKLIETIPELKRKGATMPYTSLNGHMFSFLAKEGALGLRLPVNAREDFLKKYKTTLFETHGTVLKEYVLVPDALLHNTNRLKEYFALSYEYIKTLKPKPAKRDRRSK